MTAGKRKVSVSIDAELVDELERGDDGLSKQGNDAVRETLERRRRFVQLERWLASLARLAAPYSNVRVLGLR
jgi:hypothetical protein